jgi:hypothetical protein
VRHSLISQYREMHDHGHFSGMSIYKFVDDIAKLVRKSGAKTLLDYGSGKGRQYVEGRAHEVWGGIMPTLYDPGVAGLAERPSEQFDGVICTDVMEHIPEEEVLETLTDIRSYARLWCFISICCRPAKKNLPDGRNVHVTIQNEAWWLEQIAVVFNGAPDAHVRFERPGDKGKPTTGVKLGKAVRERENWAKQDPAVCILCGDLWLDDQSHCKCGGHYTMGRAKGAAPKAWNVLPDGTWVPKRALLKKL